MLLKSTTNTILREFFLYPTSELYLKGIARSTHIAHTSVKRVLGELLEQNIIIKINKQFGKRIYPVYKANIENSNFTLHKRVFNLQLLLESDMISKISAQTGCECVVLFGSFLRGEDVENSDIDLFVQSHSVSLDLSEYETFFRRKVQLHFFREIQKISVELRLNIINGFVLQGYVDETKTNS